MHRTIRVALAAAALVPSVLWAQGDCSGVQQVSRDACVKGRDLFTFMLPQLGVSLAGGNGVLGSTGTLGKVGRFNLGFHGTILRGDLPQFDNITMSPTDSVSSNIDTKKQVLGAPGLDAQIGLFGGLPLGVTHVGTVDALVSFIYIPDVAKDNGNPGSSSLSFDGHTHFGFGARVGLIDEAIIIPGVSFTYLQRGLPSLSVTSTSQDNASFGVQNLTIDVATWRLMATKSFLLFAISAGFGGDSYKSDGAIIAQAPLSAPDTVALSQTIKRTNWFLDVTLKLGPIKVAGELGGVSGGTANTFNVFDPKATASRQYASAGVRFGF